MSETSVESESFKANRIAGWFTVVILAGMLFIGCIGAAFALESESFKQVAGGGAILSSLGFLGSLLKALGKFEKGDARGSSDVTEEAQNLAIGSAKTAIDAIKALADKLSVQFASLERTVYDGQESLREEFRRDHTQIVTIVENASKSLQEVLSQMASIATKEEESDVHIDALDEAVEHIQTVHLPPIHDALKKAVPGYEPPQVVPFVPRKIKRNQPPK